MDNGGGADTSGPELFTITVTPVNDPPTFTKGANQSLLEEAIPVGQTVTHWATGMSPGPLNEAGQTLNFIVTPDNSAKFSVQPAVDATTGTLTYTLAANRNGTVSLNVALHDNGGTSPGVDTSAVQTFTITILGVDQAPVAVNDLTPTVVQGSGPTTIDVLANDFDPDADPLTIIGVTQGTNGHVAIAANKKSLTYDPNGSFIGTDTFLYEITDGRGKFSFGTVVVTVLKDTFGPVVTPPTVWIVSSKPVTSWATILVRWSGTDPGFGVKYFQLMESRNNAPFGWVTVPGAATSVARFVAIGSQYSYRVRGVDQVGNVGAWAYLANFTPTLFSEGAATYTGAWSSHPLAGALGGHVMISTTRNAVASFSCTCSSASWIGPMSSGRGTVRVYVDGVLAGTYSESSRTTLNAQEIFARTWGVDALHRIDIAVLGGRIDVDGFLILH
jgi:hypothetical protein